MKILCCGDSWTAGYGVSKPWPEYLKDCGHEIINLSIVGGDNARILKRAMAHIEENHVDLVIIGWSGVTRIFENDAFTEGFSENLYALLKDGSVIEDAKLGIKQRKKRYDDYNLEFLLNKWDQEIRTIKKACDKKSIKIIQFSVFGDQPLNEKHLIKESFLEYLANDQGCFFKYDIPIFEYDWLTENFEPFVSYFAKKNKFPKTWKKAIVEREFLRPGKNFLGCGHPNDLGQRLWAEHILRIINDKFKK